MTLQDPKKTEQANKFIETTFRTTPFLDHYFFRRQGRDHIFLFSSECYDIPQWKKWLPRSILLAVEGYPLECSDGKESCRHSNTSFSGWKDIIIPSFTDKWSVENLIQRDLASDYKVKQLNEIARIQLACYHGTTDSLQNNEIRKNVLALYDKYPTGIGLSIGGLFAYPGDYYDRLALCHFCIIPKGLGYWTHRLFEVIFAGCIPVIISDEVVLPFGDFIDWSEIVIKWPTHQLPFLIDYLFDFYRKNPEKTENIRDQIRKARCWLNYHSEDPTCSPYRAIQLLLQRKKMAFPYYNRNWGPPEEILIQ